MDKRTEPKNQLYNMRTLFLLLAAAAVAQGLVLPFRVVTQNSDGAHKYSVQLDHLVGQYWVTNITVGTPGQTFSALIDSTSALLWVADSGCNPLQGVCATDACAGAYCSRDCPDSSCCIQASSPTCYGKNVFNAKASSTYSNTAEPFIVNTTLGVAVGYLGLDNVKLGNDDAKAVTIPSGSFGQATTIPLSLRNAAGVDAVIGIGFPALVPNGPTPIFNDAINKGVVKKGTIVIWLEDQNETDDKGTGGTIYYGDDDNLHCTGNASYTTLSRASLWQYTTPSAAVNGVPISGVNNVQTIIDTTSNNIQAPAQVVNAVLSALKIKLPQSYPASVPCNSKISISFIMNNTVQTVTELNLIYKDGNGTCFLALTKAAPKGTDRGMRFELGNPFLRGRCLFFDVTNEQIGFTDAATHT